MVGRLWEGNPHSERKYRVSAPVFVWSGEGGEVVVRSRIPLYLALFQTGSSLNPNLITKAFWEYKEIYTNI